MSPVQGKMTGEQKCRFSHTPPLPPHAMSQAAPAPAAAATGGLSSSLVEELVLSLHALHAICLDGPYTLKSGLQSPFYIDLRLLVSHPKVLEDVSRAMYSLVADCPFDLVCGVPYTALPLATLMSVSHGVPMVLKRKEGVKAYGLKKSIEGTFEAGQTCLVVEDLVTSGLSVFETIQPLQACGLKVTDIVVLINREQGGRENIESRGLRLHAVVTISQVMEILERRGKISKQTVQQVKDFVEASQVEIKALQESPQPSPTPRAQPRLPYGDRIAFCKNAAGRALLAIMVAKKSNLCLSADVTTKVQLLDLAARAGPHICMLKTHVDILSDFDSSVPAALRELARQHNFLLFEDRKFADIGSTVAAQYAGGVYRIAEWSHVVNAHIIAGAGIIQGLQKAVAERVTTENANDSATVGDPRGLLLIAEMSSAGSLATGTYTDASVQMAEENAEFVFGFICQHALSSQPGMLHLSPGVQLPTSAAASPTAPAVASSAPVRTGTDALGQQYHSPHSIICVQGSDVIIVGRAILQAPDVALECQRYQQAGWAAYEESLAAEAQKAHH